MILDLRPNNPYSYGVITNFSDGTQSLDTFPIGHVTSKNDKYHIVKYGDTLDFLAFDNYGDSKYWWILFFVNDLENPFILEPGSCLVIPDLPMIKAAVL